ncbi:MAG TPA: hypothetical protein VGB04_12100 [Allosphingosinicella sp.]|jgi:hypothetical protein
MKLELTLAAVAALAAATPSGASAESPAASTCSKAAVAAAGAAVRSARSQLSALPPSEDDPTVPPATSRRIEATKDRMRDFVKAEMACVPASPEPKRLAAEMADQGGFVQAVSSDPAPGSAAGHGDRLAYQVSRVAGHPNMLAVVATLGIRCGSDSMLLLYRRSGTGWEEAMVRRSAPYREIRGGWADLRFAVSPPDAEGRWFVATVSTTPWCTSAWQGLPYELARPGPAPDRPRVILRGKGTIYLGDESDLILRAERGAFELRHDGGSLDPDLLVRRHVRRYSVSGDTVRRVQPVAENVRDFADEWIESPWAEARAWSAADPVLTAAHAQLRSARHTSLGAFSSIRDCGGGTTQLEIAVQEGPGWFLTVRGGAGRWTVERVARKAAAGCSGANRPGEP